MDLLLSSRNFQTYLLRKLVRFVSENRFPNIYPTGSTLYDTVRGIIICKIKDPNGVSDFTLLNDLIRLPISIEDVQVVYREIFTGSDVINSHVQKELVMFLLLKEVQPDLVVPEDLKRYLLIFQEHN